MMIFGLLFMLTAVVLFLWGMIRPFKSKKTDSFVSRKKIAAYSIGLFFGGAILTAILAPKLSPEQRAAIAARKAEENRVEAAEKEANAKKDAEQKAVEVVVQPVKPSVEPSVEPVKSLKVDASAVVAAKPITDAALMGLSLKKGSKLYKFFGVKRSEELERKRIDFAKIANNDARCDAVYSAELHSISKKDNAFFFADCNNGTRLYMFEADGVLKSKDDVNPYAKSMFSSCKEIIKANAKYKSSVNVSMMSSEQRISPSGDAWTDIPFTAKNDFGNELPMIATCSWNVYGELSFSLRNN